MTGFQHETPRGLAMASFRAMGTTVALLAPQERLAEATRLTRDLFEEWEQALSRFRPESEVSRLTASTGHYVKLSPLLYEALSTALDAARATRGVFDPTLRERMIQIGYDRNFDELKPHLPASVYEQPAATGAWREIRLDDARRMARLPRGVGLDFGGIGKGMAVDAALDLLEEVGMIPALVNAGGDLAVRGLPAGETRWTVAAPGKGRAWAVGLERGALATSGVERRRWRQGKIERHHLIDPRTGEPAQSGLWSVTAAAGSCAQAEVAAKTALILGEERGAAFIEEVGLAALLVRDDGEWLTAGAWPREAMRLLESDAAARRGEQG
ncbi:MAG TPA: FAD:protein FMN transferase [Ktedonobacterales bacterium]|nr:FAD:protein FMN transferase [Ktedonobacterales bacterium]